MLTIFSVPKSFHGHINVIQRNAISSWSLLCPRPEIILFGNDKGTREAAMDFEARHVPEVRCNSYGTPLIDDIFCMAQEIAKNDILCYVNCDIILMSDFMNSIEQVYRNMRKCLIVGRRWNIDLKNMLDFSKMWEADLRSYVLENGESHTLTGIDYFVFHRGLYKKIPPFAIGRTVWDNWLVYYIAVCGFPVVDISKTNIAIHQNHDYSHHKLDNEYDNEETHYNFKLGGNSYIYTFNIKNATYRLVEGKLKLNIFSLIYVYVVKLYNIFPFIKPLVVLLKRIREKDI